MIVVVGASLAGYAAAARLARVNHDVTVLTEGDAEPAWPGTEPDDVVTLPAAWRDLFTKTGRPLSAVLGVRGLDLVPAPPRVLPDGLELPDDRAGQWHALVAARGQATASAWQRLLDAADNQWLVLRQLGVEAAFPRGADPRRTPGWLVTRLALERTFGRWRLQDATGPPQPAQRLATLLLERCRPRGVEFRTDAGVTAVRPGRVETTAGTLDAAGVVLTVDPGRAATLTGRRGAAGVPGLLEASAWSPAGPEPWAQLLSGALAAYELHEHLTGEDMRPTNKAWRPPPPRRRGDGG